QQVYSSEKGDQGVQLRYPAPFGGFAHRFLVVPVEIKQRNREQHDTETVTLGKLPLRVLEQPASDHHAEKHECQQRTQSSSENERQHSHSDHGVRECSEVREKIHFNANRTDKTNMTYFLILISNNRGQSLPVT